METSGLSDGVGGHLELEGQRGSVGPSCIDSFFLERKSLTERLLGEARDTECYIWQRGERSKFQC